MAKVIFLFLISISTMAMEKVYVIDTEINFNGTLQDYKCKTGHKAFIPNMWGDPTEHGSIVASLIVNGLPRHKVCVISLKVFNMREESDPASAIISALNYLLTQESGFINMSLNGRDPIPREKELLTKLLSKGFKISIAAGNDGLDLSKNCRAFPACYFTTRHTNVKISSNKQHFANKNGPVTDVDNEKSGTSFSTARTTNKWINLTLNRR